MDGSRGDCRVRGCVIYFLIIVAENFVTNCCAAGADFILVGTRAELFMRIRSQIIIFVLIIIISLLFLFLGSGAEFLGSGAEFLGSGDALLFY